MAKTYVDINHLNKCLLVEHQKVFNLRSDFVEKSKLTRYSFKRRVGSIKQDDSLKTSVYIHRLTIVPLLFLDMARSHDMGSTSGLTMLLSKKP